MTTTPPPVHLRIMMVGKSEDKKQALCNLITDSQSLLCSKGSNKQRVTAIWNGNSLTVVKTPDIFSLSEKQIKEEIRSCINLCPPGPNVLLLLVKPSEFTENNRQTLNFILSLFGPDAFKHSVVVLTHEGTGTKYVDDLITDCEGRFYILNKNRKLLMEKIERIVHKNRGSFLTINDQMKPSMNLVLCGKKGRVNTSIVEAILGQKVHSAVRSPEQCVKHEGQVCGRWVSLVELPALSGKPLEAVMQQCLSCISLCGPEGVHAFILVLPEDSLTVEDKAELKTIQDTFGSQVDLFTMILFTVDSERAAHAKANIIKGDRDIRELSQSCGGRCFIYNPSDQQQVSVLLDYIETLIISRDKPQSYTTEMFQQAQIQKITVLHKKLQDTETKSMVRCDGKQRPEELRIVLIGKTGCGKSSSGNTILGREEFIAKMSQHSVTKSSQKEETQVKGRRIIVVDTPGLFDTSLSQKEVHEEMLRCVSLLAPGPHVFLLVLQIGRFTDEEKETLKLIKEGFGKNAEKFTIILMTHGDQLEMSIQDFIKKECDDSFKKLISDCGNRYHVFSNRDKNKNSQVRDLIKKIDDMVKENGGACYTNDMLQEAEAAIKKEMERIMKEKEEQMKKEREQMERKYQQEMQEMKKRMEEQGEEIERERQQRQKELREKEKKIKEEQEQRKREQKERKEEDRKKKEQEEVQRQEWEQKREALEEKIRSEEKSKETIDRKLQENRKEMEQQREQWEQERKIWWEKRKEDDEQKQQEEKRKLKQLQDEYEEEREKDKIKRMEENQRRQEQEEKERKELEEKHQKQMEDIRRTYEEEARKQAEEFNEYKTKHQREFEAQRQKHDKDLNVLKAMSAQRERTQREAHLKDIHDLVKCVSKRRGNVKKISELLTEHEEEIKQAKEEEKGNLQQKHEQELNDMLKNLLQESNCVIL